MKIEKFALVIANISKFQKNGQRKMFDYLFDIASLLNSPTAPLYLVRLTGITYK